MRIILILLCLTVNVKAFEIVSIDTENIYVQDYINILSDETKDYILEQGTILEDKTKAQIVVVVKNELEASIYDYSLELFNSLGIGDAEKNNGILLLFTTDTSEYQMIVGSGIDNYFTTEVCNAILDNYFKDNFEIGKYDQAVINFYDACFTELSNYYKVSYTTQTEEKSNWFTKMFNSSNMIIGGIALVISGIITLSVFIYHRVKHITIKPNSYIEKGGDTTNYQRQYNRGYYQKSASYSKRSSYTNNSTAKVHSKYGGGSSRGSGSKH